jgi:hypothetical protein
MFTVKFLLVRKGMTQAEVTKLIGPPDEIAGSTCHGRSHEEGWNQGDNSWYWVEFDNQTGRASCKKFPWDR